MVKNLSLLILAASLDCSGSSSVTDVTDVADVIYKIPSQNYRQIKELVVEEKPTPTTKPKYKLEEGRDFSVKTGNHEDYGCILLFNNYDWGDREREAPLTLEEKFRALLVYGSLCLPNQKLENRDYVFLFNFADHKYVPELETLFFYLTDEPLGPSALDNINR